MEKPVDRIGMTEVYKPHDGAFHEIEYRPSTMIHCDSFSSTFIQYLSCLLADIQIIAALFWFMVYLGIPKTHGRHQE